MQRLVDHVVLRLQQREQRAWVARRPCPVHRLVSSPHIGFRQRHAAVPSLAVASSISFLMTFSKFSKGCAPRNGLPLMKKLGVPRSAELGCLSCVFRRSTCLLELAGL